MPTAAVMQAGEEHCRLMDCTMIPGRGRVKVRKRKKTVHTVLYKFIRPPPNLRFGIFIFITKIVSQVEAH